VGLKSAVFSLGFLFFSNSISHAAPVLRLSSATIGPIAFASAGGTNVQTVEIFNAGDGNLNPTFTSSATWITTAPGAGRSCRTILSAIGLPCSTVVVTINTVGLPQGISTGILTVSDAGAVDAPQTITVTVRIGTISVDVPPGGTRDVPITTSAFVTAQPATQTGGSWLSVLTDAFGSFRFDYPYRIRFQPPDSMTPGTYSGTVTVSGSTSFAENGALPVSMRVTTQPIAVPEPDRLRLRIAEGAPKLEWPISPLVAFTNPSTAVLSIQNPTITGAPWLRFEIPDPFVPNGFHFVVDPAGLTAGTSSGTLAFVTNAVNGTVNVPVDLQVVPKGPPLIYYQQILNNATFVPGEPVAQGDIVVIKGEQLSFSPFTFGNAPPLATRVGGASVLVNGVAAPIYYTSYSQIAFQIPVDAGVGPAIIQAQRDDGTVGNRMSVEIVLRAPRIIVSTNQNGTVNTSANRARVGEVVTLWSIGLGPTNPAVATGVAAPSVEPFARVTPEATVAFGSSLGRVIADPQFAALTPGFAGLYQVNVLIPEESPRGAIDVRVAVGEGASNAFTLYVQ
jgi:uncharacterized protein (TIGR03437 family)